MPQVLKEWLEGLLPGQAREVSEYLDGNPDAVSEILETLAESA